MDKPLLSETRSWRGNWWPPEKVDDAVAGVLTYEPSKGLTLDLIGGFDHRIREEVRPGVHSIGELRTWPVLHGVAENKEITLLDCVPIHTKHRNFGSPEEQTISARTALVGVHLEGRDQHMFTSCHISLEDLMQWSSSSVFGGTVGFENENLTGEGTISVEPVETPSVVVEDTTITLAHEHTLPFFESTRGSTVGRMRDTAFLRIQPGRPWPLSAALEYAKAFQDLLSLATHRACGVLWLQLWLPPEERDYPEGYPIHDRKVDVYSQHTVTGDPTAKAIDDHQALFTCHDLPFEEVVPRWLEVRQDCKAASNMVLGLRYEASGYIESQLLTAVGAAEVMHRALKIDQPPIPQTEFRALRKTLLEHVAQERQGWFKEKLGRNDPPLRDRLRALAELPDQEAMGRLVPDVEQWAKVATQARNDLAHEGRTQRQSIDELIAAVKVTSAVVVMNLLQVLGVPGERQREIVTAHPQLRLVARAARKHLTAERGETGPEGEKAETL